MNASAARVGELPAGDAGRGDHRADREVDAAGGDDERHADRQDADDAGLAQDVEHVVLGQERVGLEDRARDQQHDDDADERVLLQLDPAAPNGSGGEPAVLAGLGGSGHGVSSRSAELGVGDGVARAARPRSRLAPSSSATSSPSRMTRIRVHSPSSSSVSDETTRRRCRPSPARRSGGRSPALAPTSTPRVGSSSSSTRHCAHQPAGEHDLLLVAARQLAREPVGIVRLGVERPQLLARGLALGARR